MTAERLEIRQVVEDWAISRDSGDWASLAQAWHPGGTMLATWFDGPAVDFIEASRKSWDVGSRAFHVLGGTKVDVSGQRAIAQTRMSINVRAVLDGSEVDVIASGRFYDFFERRGSVWRIMHRRAIYEKDRLDPVAPGTPLTLDGERLGTWPEGYRHLAYVQAAGGATVPVDLPGLRGPAVEALLARGARWLAGDSE